MELGTWRYLGEQTPRDQQHLTARCNTWFQSQPGRVGSGRGGGAAGKTLERAGLHQQQVSRLREKHLSGGWAGSLASARQRVEMEKGLLRTAQPSTRSREEEKAAWGGGS